jgi:L-alanine-DL-glutamate epimerase-like enolase superfamily enzyme
MGAALAIEGVTLHPVRIPLGRTVAWASSVETHADYVILELRAGGLRGVAEGTVKLNFAGATLKTLACAFSEIFAPRLLGIDAGDDQALAEALSGIREHRLARAMVDAAVWDLRAQAAGKPLWALLGGRSGTVALSYTATRAAPEAMARETEAAVARHGFATLKIKTGQGMARDTEALDAIRAAVGERVTLYADSNRAYRADEVAAFTAMLAARDVACAEDPCALAPDRAFAGIRRESAVRLLVDGPCRSLESARLFIEAGAEALSVKIGKTGIGESLAIAVAAKAAGVRVHVGMLAEGGLGALAAASLAAALPGAGGSVPWLPCEASYFLQLPESILREPLAVADGGLSLPATAGFSTSVDWAKVARLAP